MQLILKQDQQLQNDMLWVNDPPFNTTSPANLTDTDPIGDSIPLFTLRDQLVSWIVGGTLFVFFQIFLICLAACKIEQLRNPKNKSLNILNVVHLKVIIGALILNIIMVFTDLGFSIAEHA